VSFIVVYGSVTTPKRNGLGLVTYASVAGSLVWMKAQRSDMLKFIRIWRRSTMIPLNDIWIAAFAMRHEMSLLARDGHFERIDGLNLMAL